MGSKSRSDFGRHTLGRMGTVITDRPFTDQSRCAMRSTGLSPDVVKRAVLVDVIEPARADHFLRGRPAPQPWLVPKTPPPAERVRPVRYLGRLRRPRNRMTRALVAAAVLTPNTVHAPTEQDTP